MTRVRLEAYAKLNLNLRVAGRRPDGYHDIESVVQSVTLHDDLILESASSGIELEVDDASLPADATNLAWRAAEEVRRAAGRPLGARIRLQKRVPVGAGLGGGSSDAAAALVGACRLWGLDLGLEALAALAARLGSDVPFFLSGGTALLSGRGTEVRPLPDLAARSFLVVFPGSPLATRDVYAQVQESLTPAPKIGSMHRSGLAGSDEVEAWVRVGNDLEPYARALCPAIGEIKDRLLRAGATAAGMTGSGSAVFGVFRNPVLLERATRELERSGWMVLCCATLGRADHRRGLGLT